MASDLKPFVHGQNQFGFRRRPDSLSDPDDVNVTTTCSCLMALGQSGKLGEFYGEKSAKKVAEIFANLFKAPWMSSGLIENNAFTTTLVVRLFGFLTEAGVMSGADADNYTKPWEPHLRFSNFASFARKLVEGSTPFTTFLFQLFSRNTQDRLKGFAAGGADPKLERVIVAELNRLMSATSFYDAKRFEGVTLSSTASTLLAGTLDGYRIAQLNRVLIHDSFAADLSPLEAHSLRRIADEMAADPVAFGINDYPPAAAVVYWFVDGIERAKMPLEGSHWSRLCIFAADEFRRQRSLVVANHAGMMDPVAMAMAACLCARLRSITKELRLGTNKEHQAVLPSTVELERSVVELFDEQTKSGIWPKYFPLFHYQDAGSNFCFTFELLEAILVEFGESHNGVFAEERVVEGLEKAVTWCETNRLRFAEQTDTTKPVVPYEGWNSGGNLDTLRRGQPESWATAVVHMFLWELVLVLSRHVQKRLLEDYAAVTPTAKWKKVGDLLDIEIRLDGPTSLKSTLNGSILKTFSKYKSGDSERLRRTPVKKLPLSALLFGPPGTSKTEVAKAIAADLEWSLVEIDPSHFLQDSLQNIYVQAEKIFEDVMDMAGVVVLFDEMDALVQKRDADTAIDTESRFLTTYMLPKLAKLHDRGQLVFLMATNFQAHFDDAIKRAGRFDFLLCMGPPTLAAKCASIHVFFDLEEGTPETTKAGELVQSFAASDGWLEDQLSLYTYGEFLSFIRGPAINANAANIATKLAGFTQATFKAAVKADSTSAYLRLDDLEKLRKVSSKLKTWKRLSDIDKVAFDESQVRKKGVDPKLPAIKYMLDRKQSRRQFAQITAATP
jgi:hypothetical protein